MSLDRLIDKIIKTNNPTVAGLDPKLDFIPDFIKDESLTSSGTHLRVQLMQF